MVVPGADWAEKDPAKSELIVEEIQRVALQSKGETDLPKPFCHWR